MRILLAAQTCNAVSQPDDLGLAVGQMITGEFSSGYKRP